MAYGSSPAEAAYNERPAPPTSASLLPSLIKIAFYQWNQYEDMDNSPFEGVGYPNIFLLTEDEAEKLYKALGSALGF